MSQQPPGQESLPFVAPRTSGPAAALGIVLAFVLLGLGIVLVHDALVLFGALNGTDWVSAAARWIGAVGPTPHTAWLGVALVLIGLFLLVTALRPRRRFGTPLASGAGLYLHDRDVAVLASAAARDVDGVLDARTTATASTVTVDVRTTGDAATSERVRTGVAELLQLLASPPTVKVRVRGHRP